MHFAAIQSNWLMHDQSTYKLYSNCKPIKLAYHGNFFEMTVKVGSHDPIFGANYYSNSKKLMTQINISMRQLPAETKPEE